MSIKNPVIPGVLRSEAAHSPQGRKRSITSCATCRRRKVRCDRQKPSCARCSISGYGCTYSLTGVPEKVPTPSARQSHLDDMGNLKESEEGEVGERRLKRGNDDVLERLQRLEEIVRQHVTTGQGRWEDDSGRRRGSSSSLSRDSEPRTSMPRGSGSAVGEVHSGKLLVQAGRTRYVSPLFWGVITDEVWLPFLKLILRKASRIK